MNAIFLLKNKGDVAFLYDDYTIRQGLEKMRAHGYTAIPVITKSGDYVGCISEGDFLWHIVNSENNDIRSKEEIPVIEIMRANFNPAVRIDVSMGELLNRAKEQNFVPVTDDRNKFIGIITRKDIIAYFQSVYEEAEIEQHKSNYRALTSAINI